MTCRELVEFLMDYIDNDLDPKIREVFDRHLKVCPSCVAYLQTYVQTIAMGRAAAQHDESSGACESVPEELVQAIMSAKSRV